MTSSSPQTSARARDVRGNMSFKKGEKMIPNNIKSEHIEKAISEIIEYGVPQKRNPTRYYLEYNSHYYPPKYVLSLANKFANHQELSPNNFSGGIEANNFLQKLSFDIVYITSKEKIKKIQSELTKRKTHKKEIEISADDDENLYDECNDFNNNELQIYFNESPLIARIIVAYEWNGDIDDCYNLYNDVYNNWDSNYNSVEFLESCGGFLHFDWPNNYDKEIYPKEPDKNVINYFVNLAEKQCRKLFTKDLIDNMKKITKYITLGVDSFDDYSDLHIELVSCYDLNNDKFYWTGKKYPTSSQENGLIRLADNLSNFIQLQNYKLMLLGCHDLNMFSPRARANAGEWRTNIINKFCKEVEKQKPTIVLQHPHTTDTERIWLMSWNNLMREVSTIKYYASAGKFYNGDYECRSKIDKVLDKTTNANTVDFVFY